MSFLMAALSRPFAAYNRMLERRPLVTKSVTSGVMYALGDACAQAGEHYHRTKEGGKEPFRWDFNRLGVFFVYGTFIGGPAYHYWFNNLDRLPGLAFRLRQHRQRRDIMKAALLLQRHGIKVEFQLEQLATPGFTRHAEKFMKIAADQLVFSSIYTLVFFVAIGVARGAVDKWSAERKVHSMEEAQAAIVARYGRPGKQLESDLLRLKAKLAASKEAAATSSVAPPGSQAAAAAAASAAALDSAVDGAVQEALKSPSETPLSAADPHESIDRVLALLKAEEAALADDLSKGALSWPAIWSATWNHTKEVYWSTYVADCAVWPILQYINFSLVPLQYRFLFVNAANLGWNTFLSFMANKSH